MQSEREEIVVVPHRDDSETTDIGDKDNCNGDIETYKGEASLRYAYDYPPGLSFPNPPSNDGGGGVDPDKKALLDDDDDDEDENKYPQDSYSFLALHGPGGNPIFFGFGLMPFLFQTTLLTLLILSVIHPNWRTAELEEGIDNPGNPYDDTDGIFSKFFPCNTTLIARYTQVISIFSFMVFADETLLDIARAIELLPPIWSSKSKRTDPRLWRLFLSCALRFVQGILAVVAVFLLVMTESEVVDIVLNFTAVNFISGLDETAFALARWGKFGPALKREAKRIETVDLPPSVSSKRIRGWYVAAVVPVALIVLGLMTTIYLIQQDSNKWITQTFRVQFMPGTELESYSGCYHKDSKDPSRRYTYASDTHNANASKLGYCLEKRQWVFFSDADGEEGSDPCQATENELAHSSKASTFDVSKSFDEDWFSFYNTPMDMYFIPEDNENILRNSCASFVSDGICDPKFNNFYYRYDGGDCCPATCSGEGCGTSKSSAEGAAATPPKEREIIFPNCKDPDMVPIVVEMGLATKIDQGDRTWWANKVLSLEGWDWRPRLVLECDGYTVLASSELGTRRVINTKIVSGAENCTVTIENFGLVWDTSYNITTLPNNTKMEEIRSNPIPRKIGTLTQETMLDLIDLSGNDFTGTIPSEIGLNENLTTLLLDNNALTGEIPTELEQLESLKELSVSNNALSGPFPWQIFLQPRTLSKLNFDNNIMTGTLPSEIAMLTSLTHLSLYNNSFHGFIPSELRLLTNLKELNLGWNEFYGTFPGEILSALTNLESLNIEHNSFDGTVPSEIQSLTLLRELNLGGNTFNTTTLFEDFSPLQSMTLLDLGQNSFTSPFPTSIQKLTNLKHLDLGRNTFVGEFPSDLIASLEKLTFLDLYGNDLGGILPSAIGSLTDLEHLVLAGIGLTSTIPTEVGNLRQLTYLNLEDNALTGPIPSQVGLLDKLINLDVGQNTLTGAIPTEIGLLKRLSGLWMYYNMLKGTIPCELESLSNLSVLNLNFNYLTGMIPQGLNADFLHVTSQRESQLVHSSVDCSSSSSSRGNSVSSSDSESRTTATTTTTTSTISSASVDSSVSFVGGGR